VITTAPAGRRVALVLMKGEAAEATIDAIDEDCPAVDIQDHGTYWLLEADDEICIEMERVGRRLGRSIALRQWLDVMSSFVGRAAPGSDYFRVTSERFDLDRFSPAPST
jgi:hypothetical protein